MKTNKYVDDRRVAMDPQVQNTLTKLVLTYRGYTVQEVEEIPFHWVAKTMNGDFTPQGLQDIMCSQLSAKFSKINEKLLCLPEHEASQEVMHLFKPNIKEPLGTTKNLHDFYFQMSVAPNLPESTWVSSWNVLSDLTRSIRKVNALGGKPSPLGSNAQTLWEQYFRDHLFLETLEKYSADDGTNFARIKSALHTILSHYAQVFAVAHLIPADKPEPFNPRLKSLQDEVQGWHALIKPYLIFVS